MEILGSIAALAFIIGIILTFISLFRAVDRKKHLKQFSIITAVSFIVLCVSVSMDTEKKTNQIAPINNKQPNQSIIQPQQAGFEKHEPVFLKTLHDIEISPKVDLIGKTKSYSTEYTTLSIINYPSINLATVMMIPVSDAPIENVKSLGLVGAYIKTVVHEDAAAKLVTTFTESLNKHKVKVFNSNGYNITVVPPDKNSAIPVIIIEIKKT